MRRDGIDIGDRVGIGGHASHGGYGFSSRNWGLTLDTIVALDVVLANGSYIHTTNTSYPEIYFASPTESCIGLQQLSPLMPPVGAPRGRRQLRHHHDLLPSDPAGSVDIDQCPLCPFDLA